MRVDLDCLSITTIAVARIGERRKRVSTSSVNARLWLLGGGLFWADTCSLTWVNCLSQDRHMQILWSGRGVNGILIPDCILLGHRKNRLLNVYTLAEQNFLRLQFPGVLNQ
ncbi:hypothetical protein EVAR_70542_1 [Eumeta japonica]|uniref:Uncharacterized protein n=1 Tax=Eumeta variegata TaxID=151549 RepID=A0A4C1SJQ4_EUMVA|nr:hypothetical protein EVAR_70542_1 [Eumeta japonica]